MRKLVLTSILLALVVIVLGAYTRLTDAGLGCPDWPGCYGHLTVPVEEHHIEAAELAFPERPLESQKAWNEMIHRYAAGTLGLFVLAIFVTSLVKRSYHKPLKLPTFLLFLIIFQGALGMWTVTLNLLPVVVMGHLLGGFAVISSLFLLYLRLIPYRIPGGDLRVVGLAKYAAIGTAILVIQIALGGWTSANYASLACTEMPICQGEWYKNLELAGAFSIPEAQNYEFGAHDYYERMTMHIAHRIWAVVTVVYLCWLAFKLYSAAASSLVRKLSVSLIGLLIIQVALGVSNVMYSLPLSVAVMHNAVAALLLMLMVMVCYTLYRKT